MRTLTLLVFALAGCVPMAGSDTEIGAALGAVTEQGKAQSRVGDVQIIDYGTVALDTSGLNPRMPRIQFEVPEDALSVTFYAEIHAQSNELLLVEDVDGPEGSLIANGHLRAASDYQRSASFSLPTSERPLVPGRYTVQITTPVEAPHVWVLFRRGTKSASGTIDLNLNFMPGCGLEPDDEAAGADMITSIESVLRPAGLSLGSVQRFTLGKTDPALLRPWVSDEATLSTVRALSSDRPPGLDITFVRALDDGPDGEYVGHTLGIAGGLPGAPTFHGTSGSGIVAAVGPLINGDRVDGGALGFMLAHEIGHSLGLLHTTESTGNTHDVIADTAECPASADTDGDGKVLGAECSDFDAGNVMFWNIRQFIRRQVTPALSPTQADIALRSPLVTARP